jgi:Skp family chaperone for outer membrane proteins
MTDIDIEWKDVEKKVEEDEFKKEKAAEYQQQQSDQKTEQQKTETATEDKDKFESIGLADIVSETWNSIAVDKGYEAVTPQQAAFLRKHSERLEEKYLKDRMNLMPEIEAGLTHFVVYMPKWLKYLKETKGSGEKK